MSQPSPENDILNILNEGQDMTLLSSIHSPDLNDAQRVAMIAQNMYALNMGFFNLLYDHLIIEEMVSMPFIDIEGKRREISIVKDSDKDAYVEGDNLFLSYQLWERRDLLSNELKSIIGRWLLGLHVKTDGKLATKHQRAISQRFSAELTAYSDLMNNEFYSFTDEKINALALTIVELAIEFILRVAPNFCNEAEAAQMHKIALDSIYATMDLPTEKPLIRAFNNAACNGLFLDDRASAIRATFMTLQQEAGDDPIRKETLPLDYMSYVSRLVRF